MEKKFKPGDKVKHKKNGREMDVDSYKIRSIPSKTHQPTQILETGIVKCTWYLKETNTENFGFFPEDDLELISKGGK